VFHSILSELISASSSDKKKLPRLFNLLPRKNGFSVKNTLHWRSLKAMVVARTMIDCGESISMCVAWILTDGKAVSIQMNRYANDRHADADAEGFPLDADADECNETVCKGVVRAIERQYRFWDDRYYYSRCKVQ